MPTRKPPTYDDIVRRTVLDPDGSVRPSADQERQAYEGFRAMDDHERALFVRVRHALTTAGIDLERVSIEVKRDHVTVRGQVRDLAMLHRIPRIVENVGGVALVIDELVVEPR